MSTRLLDVLVQGVGLRQSLLARPASWPWHRNDRVSTTKYTEQPNCTTISTTFYSYVPRNATGSLDYCIIRDLSPYGYTAWRAQCTGE